MHAVSVNDILDAAEDRDAIRIDDVVQRALERRARPGD